MADISAALRSWSTNAASNSPLGSTPIGTGLDDNLRQLQATVRQYLASKGSNISSGGTVNLAAADGYIIDITGSSGPITSFGTEQAGISYWLRFTNATPPSITYNATSMILPGSANLQLAQGDVIRMTSLGSGNWVCTSFMPRAGFVTLTGTQTLTNKTLTAPTITGPTVTGTLNAQAITGTTGVLTAGLTIGSPATATISAAGDIAGVKGTFGGALAASLLDATAGFIATAAEIQAGLLGTKLITPLGLKDATSSSLGTDGYYYPAGAGGLKFKWGVVSCPEDSSDQTFSVGAGGPFTSTCYGVWLTGGDSSPGTDDDNQPYVVSGQTTKDGFRVYNDRDGGTKTCYYLAIGV